MGTVRQWPLFAAHVDESRWRLKYDGTDMDEPGVVVLISVVCLRRNSNHPLSGHSQTTTTTTTTLRLHRAHLV